MSFNRSSCSIRHDTRGGLSRRAFLTRVGIAAAGTLLLPSTDAIAKTLSKERPLNLYNTNTEEELTVICSPQKNYDRKILNRFSHFLRDHRTEQIHPMDPALLDLLYAVSVLTKIRGDFQIISGYRAPETNQMLRKFTHGVAEHSLHMVGKAIDIRTEDVGIKSIQRAALALQQGGVGYYQAADFVHMDTGAIRSW